MADNKRLILNLFSGMQDALFLGDRFARGEFVSFLQPGQFLAPSLQENRDSNDMAIISDIANVLIDSSYVNKYKKIDFSGGTELPGSVSQVYEDIVNRAALPYKELTVEEYEEIETLTNWFAVNTANYEMYRDRYLDAVAAYDFEAAKQNPSPGELKRLAQKQTDASSQWNTIGRKSLYNLKLGRYVYLTQEDPQTFWARLKQRLDEQKGQAPDLGPYYQTFLYPPVSSWNNSGWATFERTITEQDSYEYSKATSWSGGVSGAWGLISFGGGAGGSSNYEYERTSASAVTLKFDYLRVRILRPWLVEDVLGYKFWTWKKQFGCDQVISDGGNLGITPPIRPIGRMPVLPKYLIVARNLELSASFTQSEQTAYRKHLQANASLGWGPFSLSGSYKEDTQSKHVKASFDGVTFRMQHPQIIARSGLLVGKCPDPNRGLSWQGDECFPGDSSLLRSKLDSIRMEDYLNDYRDELRNDLQEVARAEADARVARKEPEIEKTVDGARVRAQDRINGGGHP